MIMTAEAQIKDYLELLSSKAPVPGGGGALCSCRRTGRQPGTDGGTPDPGKEEVCAGRAGYAEL